MDKSGFTISQSGDPYLGGMVMRCSADGKNIEVLGHNFRNNYEPCVDSYGNVWQSDNDDDGNESCRINFVMYYGNYGFLDEKSKASWTTNRINLEETIPERHWHQGDPGVVPNVLITGAGSPAGMTFYEGSCFLPFFGIHPFMPSRIITSYALICRPEKALVTHWKSKIFLKVKTSGFVLSMWLLLPMDHYLSPTGTILFWEAEPRQTPPKVGFIVSPARQILIRLSAQTC